MAISVTIVDAVDNTLEQRLRAAGMKATGMTAAELQALVQPSGTSPDVLLLDLRGGNPFPRMLPLVRRQHPNLGIAIVASNLDPALMLEAMRSGVTECVTDEAIGELEAAVSRLAAQHAAPASGQVFAFVGAKGGVGTTTVAVNVATALAKYGGALLIDLHLSGGDAALYLGATAPFSVIDALENTHRFDAAYFQGLVSRTKNGPDLLASTDRPVSGTVDRQKIRALIDFAAHQYLFTVLDIPRSDAAVLDALEAVTAIVVVANQELATVRAASRLAAMLRQRYGSDKVSLVLSRTDRQAEIGIDDIEKAVGTRVRGSFPSDYRLALKALNRGQPLVFEKSALSSAFTEYAKTLAGSAVDAEPGQEKSTGGILGILTGRR